jgi:hypothetical protein
MKKQKINLKIVGYLPIEQIGKKLKFYSNKIYKRKADAQKYIKRIKESLTIKDIFEQAGIIADIEAIQSYIQRQRTQFRQYVAKLTLKRYIKSLGTKGLEFLKEFYAESKYFTNRLFSFNGSELKWS